jgi:hypothetical protein
MTLGDREHAPHAARDQPVEVAAIAAGSGDDGRRVADHQVLCRA